ncbi:MAG: type II toxin-antitoxin system VapC family toxin [Candidatus Eremiobacterota bacterium]
MIFVDTGAWIAIEDKKDANHEKAMEFKNKILISRSRLITTNYILDETYTLMLMNTGYGKTIDFKYKLDQFISNNLLIIYYVNIEIEKYSWEVFEQFNRDKIWSFTDCTSKVVMEKLGLIEVFAFDRHFEHMGFLRKPQ